MAAHWWCPPHGCNGMHAGETLALHILTKFNNQRFEFIFTNSARWLPRAFLTVQGVFKQYDLTRLYRDVKLRGGRPMQAMARRQLRSALPPHAYVPHTAHTKAAGAVGWAGPSMHLPAAAGRRIRQLPSAHLADHATAVVQQLHDLHADHTTTVSPEAHSRLQSCVPQN